MCALCPHLFLSHHLISSSNSSGSSTGIIIKSLLSTNIHKKKNLTVFFMKTFSLWQAHTHTHVHTYTRKCKENFIIELCPKEFFFSLAFTQFRVDITFWDWVNLHWRIFESLKLNQNTRACNNGIIKKLWKISHSRQHCGSD